MWTHQAFAGPHTHAPVLSGGAGIDSLAAYEGEASIGMMTYGLSQLDTAFTALRKSGAVE